MATGRQRQSRHRTHHRTPFFLERTPLRRQSGRVWPFVAPVSTAKLRWSNVMSFSRPDEFVAYESRKENGSLALGLEINLALLGTMVKHSPYKETTGRKCDFANSETALETTTHTQLHTHTHTRTGCLQFVACPLIISVGACAMERSTTDVGMPLHVPHDRLLLMNGVPQVRQHTKVIRSYGILQMWKVHQLHPTKSSMRGESQGGPCNLVLLVPPCPPVSIQQLWKWKSGRPVRRPISFHDWRGGLLAGRRRCMPVDPGTTSPESQEGWDRWVWDKTSNLYNTRAPHETYILCSKIERHRKTHQQRHAHSAHCACSKYWRSIAETHSISSGPPIEFSSLVYFDCNLVAAP